MKLINILSVILLSGCSVVPKCDSSIDKVLIEENYNIDGAKLGLTCNY